MWPWAKYFSEPPVSWYKSTSAFLLGEHEWVLASQMHSADIKLMGLIVFNGETIRHRCCCVYVPPQDAVFFIINNSKYLFTRILAKLLGFIINPLGAQYHLCFTYIGQSSERPGSLNESVPFVTAKPMLLPYSTNLWSREHIYNYHATWPSLDLGTLHKHWVLPHNADCVVAQIWYSNELLN